MREKPVRKLSRLGNEMHIAGSRAVLDLAAGKHDRGVVALLLLSRCAADWMQGDAIRRPAAPTQAMSIRAIANSLHAPYASIHRHVTALRQAGLVIEVGTGVAISNADDQAASVIRFLTAAHDAMVRLVEDLAPDSDFPPPRHAPAAGLRGATLATALDIWLIPFEVGRWIAADWTGQFVWLFIVIANVRHITLDPVASECFACEPTPDALRRPISVRAIAAATGLSYGTTYRHCQALAAQDLIAYDRGGWLTVSRQLGQDDVDHNVTDLLAYYAKRIRELIALGLDVDRVGERYLDGRPAYVRLPSAS